MEILARLEISQSDERHPGRRVHEPQFGESSTPLTPLAPYPFEKFQERAPRVEFESILSVEHIGHFLVDLTARCCECQITPIGGVFEETSR